MKKLLLLLSVVIAGCGGGGGPSSTVNNSSVSSAASPVVQSPTFLFDNNPQLLPDLRNKYNKLCGNNVAVQSVSAANLTGHKDGKKDLIFSLWCPVDDSVRGLFSSAPVINGMVAFIQQANGEFVDGTQTIFHTDMVDLGGNGNDVVVYDFNNDGYDDIVWGTSPEDGRLEPVNFTGNYVQKVFMTSDGKGGYNIEKLGLRTKTYYLQLMDNELGGKDIVSTFIGWGGYPEVWRYSNGWKLISSGYESDYSWISNSFNLFFNRKNSNENSHTAISTTLDGLSLELHTRVSNFSKWIKSDTFTLQGLTKTIPFMSWSNEMSQTSLLTINGKDYVQPYFGSGCEIKRKPNEDSIAIVLLGASELNNNYNGSLITEGVNMTTVTKIMAFATTNNKITNININIKNENTKISPMLIKCNDVNGDGYDDITIYTIGKNVKPVIYLNDGNGNFSLVDTSKFPAPSTDYFDTSMSFVDVDGNGTNDLIYFPANRVVGNPSTIQYQLYKGKRLLSFIDLASQN